MTITATSLKVGDIIEVHGWCMLAKLEPGKYRVSKVGNLYGKTTYSFTKPKGKKHIVTHYATDVCVWIEKADHPDLNKIVIVTN
jgi:hypothetical protein